MVGRSSPRTEMFIQPSIRVFSKTGSLGLRYFTQDCGVLIDRTFNAPLATFGYCSEGWRLPGAAVDLILGHVGIEIAKAVDIPFTVNADWTPEGAALLLGDLWEGR